MDTVADVYGPKLCIYNMHVYMELTEFQIVWLFVETQFAVVVLGHSQLPGNLLVALKKGEPSQLPIVSFQPQHLAYYCCVCVSGSILCERFEKLCHSVLGVKAGTYDYNHCACVYVWYGVVMCVWVCVHDIVCLWLPIAAKVLDRQIHVGWVWMNRV